MKLRWRFGVLAGIFLALFCLYPQMKMFYLRGSEWNGHYAYNDIDEVAYASYVRALIDGRPRKNDPYSGRDQTPEVPQPESLFSIQFAAPYTISIPARIFGVGTPMAMILAGAIAGFFAAFLAFWLLGRLTGDNWYAMAAALAVFAFGTVAAGEGAMSEIFFDGFSYPNFPGFRRYIPALGMPAFFLFVGSLWMLIGQGRTTEANDADLARAAINRKSLVFVGVAIVAFSYCLYSYFYIWTTAKAFLGCLFLVWLIERPEGWRDDLKRLAFVGAGCVLALLPYAYLLSQRGETMDHVQLLVHTRMPDFFRFPEYISFGVLLMLIVGVALKRFELKDRAVLFVLGLALVSFVVFNQQVITGRSLQPIHYQVFIGNYVAALAVFGSIGLLWRTKLGQGRTSVRIISSLLFVAAVFWGFVECHYTVRVLDEANIERDKGLLVAKRLEELAKQHPDPHRMTVLSFDGIFADDMPSVAPQNILWARHQHVFAGLSWQESTERYYQQLYYSGATEKTLDWLLKNDFVSQIALFGWGRHTDRLSVDAKPLTYGEIDAEVRKFGEYVKNFSIENARTPTISYFVARRDDPPNLENLERWYEITDSEAIGDHILYEVRLK
ncbi:hypothetical protein [Leptolyngbya sp. 7M]|uniref:hypothetical protein n=1 Tax=Leptolyngbya sp. 7M TaxID=2812896 RepID=UPI001B8BDCC4|nr:hypothetical protein [Leptolyngbya sp. 7M]QYO66495.1 hypothetical protein JVX88_06760 [Leptolyngbya sp. 7M]